MSAKYAAEAREDGIVIDLFGAALPYAIQVISNTEGPSMARQEFKDECDINFILRGYENGKVWPPALPGVEPMYVDWSAMPSDLQSAMNMMQAANDAFMTLHANVRREFDNDPVRFVDFCSRSENLGKLREWGLAPPASEAPVASPSVPPVAGGATGAPPA